MRQAETQKKSGDNRRCCKHVSADPNPVDDQSSNVWKSCRQRELGVCARTPGERMTTVGSGKAAGAKPLEECWVYSSGANQVKRCQEICDHNIIPFLNMVCTSSLHLVYGEVEECSASCMICPEIWAENHSEGQRNVALWPLCVLCKMLIKGYHREAMLSTGIYSHMHPCTVSWTKLNNAPFSQVINVMAISWRWDLGSVITMTGGWGNKTRWIKMRGSKYLFSLYSILLEQTDGDLHL